MSGIFGIFQRDGSPASSETLEAMREKMAYWGPDGNQVLMDGSIGLGQCLLYNTPEALNERLPRCSTDGELLFTCEARIDNRQDLFSALSVPYYERNEMPDSELILRAYRKWGIDCPDHLLGDWSFAVWDKKKKHLFLARDHRGITAFYYYLNHQIFAFASSIKALLVLPAIKLHVNELYLAQRLVSWPSDPPENTIYEHIKRLPDAHCMLVTPEQVKIWRYWFMENIPELRLKTEGEYIEGFLDHYREAVRCRLRSYRPVCAHLSSGLDSGSVVALAAEEMQKRGERLQAYISVPAFDINYQLPPNRYGDEWRLANMTSAHCGNVDLDAISAKNSTPIQAIYRALEIHHEPLHAASNMYWILQLMESAKSKGLGALLTGQWGNATVSWNGWWGSISLSTLIRQRNLKQIIKYKILAPFVPASVFDYYQMFRSRRNEEPWSDYSAINPAFARRINLLERMHSSGHDPTYRHFSRSSHEARIGFLTPGKYVLDALYAEIGAAYDCEVRDPTVDKRLIEYCVGIPDNFYITDNQSTRLIIRRAMEGYLPDEVRLNKRRGLQAADLGYRLLADAQNMETSLALLNNFIQAQTYLDTDKMQVIWKKLQQQVDFRVTMDSMTILLRGLMAGLFLYNGD
ncbi:MAG: asparagine synthetase B [Chloroflexi bacterium HGW-Chloroflexi-6]|nr:MAG: asparagine synthetase B [Chloroflexi bacterium HGW-Chloroflexi-6]